LVAAVSWPFDSRLGGKVRLVERWFRQSGITCGAYDIDLAVYDGGDPLAYDWDDRLRRWTQLPWLRRALSAEDIREAKRDGAVALYANYQPMIPLSGSLAAIDCAYAKAFGP
jgi:hypothetical protein